MSKPNLESFFVPLRTSKALKSITFVKTGLFLLFFREVFHKAYISGLGFYEELTDLFWPYANLLFSNSTVKLQRADFDLIRYKCY